MKLVGYLRVSTDRQAEQGYGLDVQEAAIRAWAKTHGHRIVAMTRDEGVSGSNSLATRDGLVDALKLLKKRRAQGLVVYRLDRLARDVLVQEAVMRDVWASNDKSGEVFSTDTGEQNLRDDPDEPTRKMVRRMLGILSEYERDLIALRLRRGRRRKAEQDGYAYGSPRFGMRAQDRKLVPDSDEAATIARLLELHSEERSLRQIAAQLNKEGLRPKRAAQWYPTTVARVIKRQSPAPV